MSESIITRSGGGSSSGSGYTLQTEIFTENAVWVVPEAKNQEFSVRIFGGGGGGGTHYSNSMWSGGGGGGWMNNDILTLNQGIAIQITIGTGGNGYIYNSSSVQHQPTAGGTTFFGSYLSANGGTPPEIIGNGIGGNGGSGGSGVYYGGTGYQFGGGGGKFWGGNGGYWGGGGGEWWTGSGWSYNYGRGGWYNNNGTWMQSGLAGNGSQSLGGPAINGTNTIGLGLEFEGPGLAGQYINISKVSSSDYNKIINEGRYCGGGGYGGNGGYCGGGGGGYGADGGNDWGGGGGYGKGGLGGSHIGGGGGYGRGGEPNIKAGFGGGGGASTSYGGNSYDAGNGICIIQYYKSIIS